jgi:hypothetical protein
VRGKKVNFQTASKSPAGEIVEREKRGERQAHPSEVEMAGHQKLRNNAVMRIS